MKTETKKISDKIMLVTISIHQWYPRKKDPKATAELAAIHGIDPVRAGNFHKILVDLDSIKPLQLKLPEQTKNEFKAYAGIRGKSMKILFIEMFEEYKENHKE